MAKRKTESQIQSMRNKDYISAQIEFASAVISTLSQLTKARVGIYVLRAHSRGRGQTSILSYFQSVNVCGPRSRLGMIATMSKSK
jgi:hypothetical protein